MSSVFDVLESEGDQKLRMLATNPSACQFLQGVIQHLAIVTAGKGLRAQDVEISAPFIEGDELCATIRWTGALQVRHSPAPEPMAPKGDFLAFMAHEQSVYADFVRQSFSLRRFLERMLEVVTTFTAHHHLSFHEIQFCLPHVVDEQYIRTSLFVNTTIDPSATVH